MDWFDKEPGGLPTQDQGDGSVATLIGGLPDAVRMPPELGGGVGRVVSAHQGRCPKCERGVCRHLQLSTDVSVAECQGGCGFVWYRAQAQGGE